MRQSILMKFKPIRLRPMTVMPLIETPRFETSSPFGERSPLMNHYGPETLPDSGHQRPCTPEDMKIYKQNWQGIVPVVALSHLRRHKEDVLHGCRSLNMLLPTQRKTKDFDIYSPHAQKSASGLEASIDRMVGCDICETEYCRIPKSALLQRRPDAPSMSDKLYRVRTKTRRSFLQKKDPDVDVMKRPEGVNTIRKAGITHESLQDAYERLQYLRDQPSRGLKVRQDMRRIEEYLISQGHPLPPNSLTARTSILMRPRRMIL